MRLQWSKWIGGKHWFTIGAIELEVKSISLLTDELTVLVNICLQCLVLFFRPYFLWCYKLGTYAVHRSTHFFHLYLGWYSAENACTSAKLISSICGCLSIFVVSSLFFCPKASFSFVMSCSCCLFVSSRLTLHACLFVLYLSVCCVRKKKRKKKKKTQLLFFTQIMPTGINSLLNT